MGLLPKGWKRCKLGDILLASSEKIDPSKSEDISTYIGLEHIEKDSGKLLGYGSPLDVKSTKSVFNKGDLLYGKLRPYLNKVIVADNDGICSTDILVFKENQLLCNRFIKYRLLSRDFVAYTSSRVTGVQHPRVSEKTVLDFEIYLPPLREQGRIAAKIEELFSRLDAGVEALKAEKAQISRYRQSVLEYVFCGKLFSNVKYNSKSVAEIGTVVTGTTPSKKVPEYYGSDILFYKPTDLNAGYNVCKSDDMISKKGAETARVIPKNSVLVTCIGATIGKTGFNRVEGATNQQINAIIPGREILPEYLYYYCISPSFQKSIVDNSSSTTLPIINKSRFERLKITISDLTTQKAIVVEIEHSFSICDKVEKTINENLKRAEKLRQSILKRAFEGKLVPQDPSDEPADLLLERIKQEKARLEKESKTRRTKANGK